MAFLELRDLEVGYQKNAPVLKDFHLAVEQGELVSLLGPSGCGKTTTLRTVAGFIAPTQGRVQVGGADYTRLPPHRRNIGLVFQNYALFPHLTVFANVAFGLRMRRVARGETDERVRAALARVGMAGYEDRYPAQLSGGQQQRVALARAIVIEPDLLLLDEPLSNLDAKLRVEMRAELRRLQKDLGITMLYVTHDQAEALSLSDRIIVMNHGVIEQMGTPEAIYHHPATGFVAAFMGYDNQFTAQVTALAGESVTLDAAGLTLHGTLAAEVSVQTGQTVAVFFRPNRATIQQTEGENCIPGRYDFHTFQGSTTQYFIQTDLGDFGVLVAEEAPQPDLADLYLHIAPRHLIVTPHDPA